MKRDRRLKSIEYYEHKITNHQRALDVIKTIPMNKVLHIETPAWVCISLTSRERRWEDSGMIVIPRTWNVDSIRCHLLAIEKRCYASEKIAENHNTPLQAIRFLDIKSWKEFDRSDAGLYINWIMSHDFKYITYGKKG